MQKQRIYSLIGCLLLLSSFSIAYIPGEEDPRSLWAVLGKVTFNKSADVLMMNMTPPTYGKKVQELEGKEIIIEGYVIPMDFGDDYIVISSNPFATCFFCGGAGPETVMEVYLKKPLKKKKEKITVRGILKLNRGEIEHLTYMLKEATVVED